jgi:hypothetical protein
MGNMDEKNLSFKEVKKDEDIKDVSKFDVQVFTETQDFQWSYDSIKKELKNGWKLVAVQFGDETVAAIVFKSEKDTLFTKNTPIKMAFQGNGFSHMIKDFYEGQAGKLRLKRVVNYCPVDNFRMISLNESHGYRKTGNYLGNNKNIVEWEKLLI